MSDSSQRLELVVLGGLALRRGGQPVAGLASRKAEALLAYLACNPCPHQREVLADLFWDDRPRTQALGNLRVLLTALRPVAGDALQISRQSVVFDPTHAWVDARELESAVAALEGVTGALLPRELVEQLEAATSLYRGDFLHVIFVRSTSGFEEWASDERERLRQMAISALDALVRHDLAAGEFEMGQGHAVPLLALDNLREQSHRHLMLLYARSGQTASALAQYDACRQVLQALSTLAGGFRREAAAQVAGAGLAHLAILVDRSFIQRTPTGRYAIHEYLRQFGAAHLAAAPEVETAVRQQAARYFDRRGQAFSLNHLGEVALALGRLDEAEDRQTEATRMFAALGSARGVAWTRLSLGQIALARGDLAGAEAGLTEARALALEMQAVPVLLQVLVAQGALLLHRGRREAARHILGLAARHPAAKHRHQMEAQWLAAEHQLDLPEETGPMPEAPDLIKLVQQWHLGSVPAPL